MKRKKERKKVTYDIGTLLPFPTTKNHGKAFEMKNYF
tara:strand:+ start:12 stop:122 length:111 start_codon:yes stop_codon:yes gene_type:complete